MWGLPEQTVAGALADLQQAIDLSPEHISWYQLTIEAKTEFARRPPLLPKDGLLQDIEAAGLALLADAGFERYENICICQTRQTVRTQSHVLELR